MKRLLVFLVVVLLLLSSMQAGASKPESLYLPLVTVPKVYVIDCFNADIKLSECQ